MDSTATKPADRILEQDANAPPPPVDPSRKTADKTGDQPEAGNPGNRKIRPKPGDLDPDNTPYDPEQHERLQVPGRPWRRKRGRGAAKADRKAQLEDRTQGLRPPPEEPDPEAGSSAAPESAATLERSAAAALITDTCVGLAVLALGPDWQYEDQAERAAVVGPVEAYLATKPDFDLSPGWALVATAAGYAGKRLHRKRTQSRLAKARAWIKGRVSRLVLWWRERRAGRSEA